MRPARVVDCMDYRSSVYLTSHLGTAVPSTSMRRLTTLRGLTRAFIFASRKMPFVFTKSRVVHSGGKIRGSCGDPSDVGAVS